MFIKQDNPNLEKIKMKNCLIFKNKINFINYKEIKNK